MALEKFETALVPGDSASNVVRDDSLVGSVVPELSKCVFTADDYLRFVELLGVSGANDMRDFMAHQLATIKQCLSIGAYSARVSSAGSASSSNRQGGSTSSSRGAAAGLHGARASGLDVARKRRPRKVPDGLCYTKLFNSDNLASQAERMGKWPTLSSLLKKPASVYQSVAELGRFRLVGDADCVHVKAGGSDGQSFLDSTAFVVASVKQTPGSLGALIKSLGSRPSSSLRLNLRTVVGGFVSPYLGLSPEHSGHVPVKYRVPEFAYHFGDRGYDDHMGMHELVDSLVGGFQGCVEDVGLPSALGMVVDFLRWWNVRRNSLLITMRYERKDLTGVDDRLFRDRQIRELSGYEEFGLAARCLSEMPFHSTSSRSRWILGFGV